VKLVHLVGFIIKKFVTMHDHINLKFSIIYFCLVIEFLFVLMNVIS